MTNSKIKIDITDIIGKKIGKWNVINYIGFNEKIIGKTIRNVHTYFCKCECGTERDVERGRLTSNKSLSCGCERSKSVTMKLKTHGLSGDRLYYIYNGMIDRCYNVNSKNYKRYGKRGITICEEWTKKNNGFINFVNWSLENDYDKELSIDRINVNGNYEPSNCKWSTDKEQANNRRNNVKMNATSPSGEIFKNIEYVLDFCKYNNLTHTAVYDCLNGKRVQHKGWTFQKIKINESESV